MHNIINIQNTEDQVDQVAVGIDFGTTNSLVCVIIDNDHRVLKIYNDDVLFPSILYFDNKGGVFFTDNVEKTGIASYIKISSIKRLLGISLNYVKNNPHYFVDIINKMIEQSGTLYLKIHDKFYSVPDLIALFLSHLKTLAQKVVNHPITKCVLSIPAYFDNNAKSQIMQAARLANLEVLRLIAEPTAAAYAYKLDKNSQGKYLVYDLGGGTFDASLIQMHQGALKVIAITGDNLLGGDDIDNLLAAYISKTNDILFEEALHYAKKYKETDFSDSFFKNRKLKIDILQAKECIKPLIMKTIRLCKQLLIEQDIEDDLQIILVGGSTKLSFIKDLIKKELCYSVLDGINPDASVVIGGAYQAHALANHVKADSLMDVVPLSLGIELADGLVERIIERNSPIPIVGKTTLTTCKDYQTAIQFHVVQGEREFAKDCRSLTRFELANLDPKQAMHTKVDVVFSLDANGILYVSAVEEASGVLHDVVVNPTYSLTQQDVSGLIKNALDNIQSDHEKKQMHLQVLYAKNLIDATTAALNNSCNNKDIQHVQYHLDVLKQKLIAPDVTLSKFIDQAELHILPFLKDNINANIVSIITKNYNSNML